MEDIETCIAHILKRKIPIEWIRYNMFLQNNIYKNIPVLVFRVDETCNPELIENLKKCVSDFQGKLSGRFLRIHYLKKEIMY